MDKSNYTCIFLCVCTYTLPTSPTNDHLQGDTGQPGKIIQRATHLSKRTHSSILNIVHRVCDTILSPSSLTNTCSVGYVTPTRFTRLEHTHTVYIQCLCMYISNHTCMFPHLCTYTLPTSPINDHLWDDPGRKGKNTQRATYLSKRTHSQRAMYLYTLYHPKHSP